MYIISYLVIHLESPQSIHLEYLLNIMPKKSLEIYASRIVNTFYYSSDFKMKFILS